MARYVLDTSWISNPLLEMPPDIHISLWSRVKTLISDGAFCWNMEIWEELDGSIKDPDVAACLRGCHTSGGCFEVAHDRWDWNAYLERYEGVKVKYRQYISEYNGMRKSTVGLNDCSIVCLGKTLGLPVASMEAEATQPSSKKMRIPELCKREGVEHVNLTQLFRKENITA